jgi:hypothetical protein
MQSAKWTVGQAEACLASYGLVSLVGLGQLFSSQCLQTSDRDIRGAAEAYRNASLDQHVAVGRAGQRRFWVLPLPFPVRRSAPPWRLWMSLSLWASMSIPI